MKKKYFKQITFILLAIIIGIVSYSYVVLLTNIELKSNSFQNLVSNNIFKWLQVDSINFIQSLKNIILFILGILFFAAGPILRMYFNKGTGERYTSPISGLLRKKKFVPFDVKKINAVLPDFNPEEFKNKTYNIYVEIQNAWMNFDNIKLRDLVTDEMYNMYIDQLEILKNNNKQNIVRDFELDDFKIVGMEFNDTSISIVANYKITCYDYIINTTNNKTIKGRDTNKVTHNYQLLFIRSIITDDNNDFCPNCGAPVSDKASRQCLYCGSIIVSDEHDWVMADKMSIKNELY